MELKEIKDNMIDGDQIFNRKRDARTCTARHAFCYLARKEGYSYSEIGRFLGKKHSSVIHSVKVAEGLIEINDNQIRRILG